MKFISTLAFSVCLLAPLSSWSQGWQWGRQTTFSNNVPFEDSWLEALSSDGYLYTFTCLGSQSGTTLSNVVTHCGALNVTDSTNCVQVILSKIDSNGNYIWNLASQHSNVGCTNIATDQEGNIYITGVFDSATVRLGSYTLTNPFTPNYATFLAKVNSSGNVVWGRTMLRAYPSGMDDVRFGQGGLTIDGTGHVYVSGTFTLGASSIGAFPLPSTGLFDNDLYLSKYDSTGTLQWAKAFGNVSGYYLGNNLIAKPGGSLYISGQYQSSPFVMGPTPLTSPTGYGFFLALLDSSGSPLWAKNMPGNMYDVINGMTSDKDMNIYLTGAFYNDTIIFGHDTLLNFSTGGLNSDLFLAKYDSAGNEIWARRAGSYGSDQGFSVAPDTFGNVWVAGNMAGGLYSLGYVMNFGGPGDTISGPPGSSDPLFIAHYTKDGTYLSALVTKSLGDDQCNIVVDKNKNFYLTGDWWETTEVFGPDTLFSPILPYYERSATVKYNYSLLMAPLNIPEPAKVSAIIYPNPTTNEVTVAIKDNITNAVAQLFDITGKEVRNYTLKGENNILQLDGIQPGMYFIKVTKEGLLPQTLKLVVQ